MENVFTKDGWYFRKYDGRRREFRGISREDFAAARDLHFGRISRALVAEAEARTKVQKYKDTLAYFATVPYAYQGEGWEDFSKYQRPCRDGIGYVAICPGERGNNVYVDEPHAVRTLTKKYEAWRAERATRQCH